MFVLEVEASPVGPDGGAWTIRLGGAPEDLDRVRRVVYLLHPTFHNPMRVVEDRGSSFSLELEIWAPFMLRVSVELAGGSDVWLRQLLPPGEKGRMDERMNPVVFLSYSVADAGPAQQLEQMLEKEGVVVREVADVTQPGEPWLQQLELALRESDVLVAVVSTKCSGWIAREAAAATRLGIPVLPVFLDKEGELEGFPDKGDGVRVQHPAELAAAASEVSTRIHQLFAPRAHT